MEVNMEKVQKVFDFVVNEYLGEGGFHSCGIGNNDYGNPCIKLYLSRSFEDKAKDIPKEIDGVLIDVKIVSDISINVVIVDDVSML